MQKPLYFQLILFLFLFLNCKGKQTEQSTFPTYIPSNKTENTVVDLSNLFTSIEKDSLTHKINQFEKRTRNQIAVLTIDSLPNYMSIQNFGSEVANYWGVGQKNKNNGLLITVSKYDRKVAISTGIGTEEIISNKDCETIIERLIIPSFKAKKYHEGVSKALDSIIFLWN